MTSFNVDGYQNAVLGSRGVRLKTVNELFLYASGGLFAKIVNRPPEDALKKGFTITGDEEDEIDAEIDRLKLLPALIEAVQWARLTGGAAIVPLIDDGGALDMAVNFERIRKIEDLRVYSASEISLHGAVYDDPSRPEYGQPQFYEIKSKTSFIVHESRLIPIAGRKLPRILDSGNIPWIGKSIIERPYQCILDYDQAHKWAMSILERKQQSVYAMKGLAEMIANEQEPAVQKRITLVDSARSILNTVAVDSEDEYTIISSDLGGVNALIEQFEVKLAAECGIPVTLLFGRSPGGQNATGEADFNGYYDMLDGIRSKQMQPALEKLIALIIAQHGITTKPEQWAIDWPSLTQISEAEQADIDNKRASTLLTTAQALDAASQTGAIGEKDAERYLAQNGLFGMTQEESDSEAAQYAEET